MDSAARNKIRALEEMIEVVLLAIPREHSARDFYLHAAGKATSEESRELFFSLATQEIGHEAELRRILANLKAELSELRRA